MLQRQPWLLVSTKVQHATPHNPLRHPHPPPYNQPYCYYYPTQVRREKAIYHTLNKLSMDTSRKVLLAEAWCPLAAKPHVHEALRRAAQDSSTQVSRVLWTVRLVVGAVSVLVNTKGEQHTGGKRCVWGGGGVNVC